jgi:hypothetical protein
MAVSADEIARLNAEDAAAWIEAAREGDFARAWAISDRIRARPRHRDEASRPRHHQQIWDGTPLDGRRVLVRCYHGLGDTIQFARYLRPLRARAREVIVWAQEALLPLLSTIDAGLTLLPLHDGAPAVDVDADIEIMELPYAFRTTLSTIPADVPYLTVPRAGRAWASQSGTAAAYESRCVDPVAPFRVGIVWRAGEWDRGRSIEFDLLRSLFGLPGVCWYALQFDRRPDEQDPRLRAVAHSTIGETAAAFTLMDLIISIDSMSAHLAGALGCPVWTLLPREADWRWMRERSDSPWYPTMRLFRQARPEDWAGVVAQVGQALRDSAVSAGASANSPASCA